MRNVKSFYNIGDGMCRNGTLRSGGTGLQRKTAMLFRGFRRLYVQEKEAGNSSLPKYNHLDGVSLPKRLMKKFIAGFTAAITALSMMSSVTSVFAENSYTPVTGTSVAFEKYLTFNASANTPSVTFDFTIAPGEAQAAAENKQPVLAGNDSAVTGAPTVGSATFAASDAKYTTAQATEDGIGQKTTLTQDPVDLTGGKAYSRHKVSVDFSGVTFAEPGVYRYVITETAMTAAQTELGFTADTDATRYLDVYVADTGFDAQTKKGSLEITGYVLHNSDGYQPSSTNAATEPDNATKAKGYINDQETHNLTFSKAVAGNQGSHDKYFKYELTLAEAGANSKFNVTLTNADGTVGSNSATLDTYEGATNAAQITTDANGAATYTFYLQHGQSIVVNGLPKNASYSVKEIAEDYAPTAAITGDTISGKTGNTPVAAAVTKTGANSEAVVADADLTADTTVAFTNTRQGTIPTGVLTSVLPGALVIMVGAAGMLFVMKKKNEEAVD